jgi:hypothetical protein
MIVAKNREINQSPITIEMNIQLWFLQQHGLHRKASIVCVEQRTVRWFW